MKICAQEIKRYELTINKEKTKVMAIANREGIISMTNNICRIETQQNEVAQ